MFVTVGQYIPHQVFEDIFFDQGSSTPCHLDDVGIFRETLKGIQVGVQFIVEAAFQSSALPTEFGLVDGEVLVTCRCCVDGFKI